MYPGRRGPYPPRRPQQLPSPQKKQNLLSLIQDADGKIDFNRINGTAKQMRQLYNQFSPLLSRFLKK
ncbi:YppG family protein [Bacillus sp. AK128]